MKPTILCVDDEIDNLEALERLFRAKYTVLKASSGARALELLDQSQTPVPVILTDHRMPEMTGVEFLQKSLAKNPDSVRLLLTGYTDIESIVAAVNAGEIYRYLTKPWDPVDLLNTVDQAFERYRLTNELKEKTDELEIAFKELQTLDQAKNQFMILINHELKTPLTSIMSFSELLAESKMDEEQAMCVSRIQKSSARLKNLIDDVLLVVAGETKTLKTKLVPFEVSKLSLQLSADFEKMKEQKGQRIEFLPLEKRLVADQSLIQQVLQRLLQNAIKFGNSHSTILIETTLTLPHRMKISVSNEGNPISPSVIDKILKPFFIDEDVMNHSVGLGLGLTICQSLLKSHQSTLQITHDARGVVVSFELPCL